MTDEADAIVVGSGINGMVAAAELAQTGWSVILLERNAEIGGFIATEERTLPGYLHDTFSSWHPMFVSGHAYTHQSKQRFRQLVQKTPGPLKSRCLLGDQHTDHSSK
jgi:phytoene dehydrogenase-like protein